MDSDDVCSRAVERSSASSCSARYGVLKPPLPQVTSFTGALSENRLEQLIFFIGWILLTAATLALLYEAVRRIAETPSPRTLRELERLERAITTNDTKPARAPGSERRYRPPLVMTVGAPAAGSDESHSLAAATGATSTIQAGADQRSSDTRIRSRLLGPFTIEGVEPSAGLRSTCND